MQQNPGSLISSLAVLLQHKDVWKNVKKFHLLASLLKKSLENKVYDENVKDLLLCLEQERPQYYEFKAQKDYRSHPAQALNFMDKKTECQRQ